MMTGAEYRASLRDGRLVYLEGRQVPDVTAEPVFQGALEWTAGGYDHNFQPGPQASGPYFAIPRSVEDLRQQEERLKAWDVPTIATSQGLLMAVTAASRMRATHPLYSERALAYFEESKRRDIRCAMGITDAKGDRSRPPGGQDDPDFYVRIVERKPDGVVVRGAKMHISSAVIAHEIMVMPTKAMKPGEEEWAFAGAIPVASPGVHLIATSVAPRNGAERYPVSRRHSIPEAMVVFDDVFVPSPRVFLAGEVEHAATWAHALGTWERLGNLSHLVDVADALVGLGHLIAEANGIQRIPHVRAKLGEMAIYATQLRASLEAAISRAEFSPEGYVTPNELFTNAGKFQAGAGFHLVVRHLHDVAGGAVLTAPAIEDLLNPETGPEIAKYMRTKEGVDAEYRMRLFHAIRDYTADAYAAWLDLTILLGGGGLDAQRAVAAKHYDVGHAKRLARRLAGLEGPGGQC